MEPLLLFSKQIPLTTVVSNIFIDQYMPDANGSFVKVYLYLAKCMQTGGQSLSISHLADLFCNTEADIMRALHYWEKKGLLQLSCDKTSGELLSITFVDPPQNGTGQKAAAQTYRSNQTPVVQSITATQIEPDVQQAAPPSLLPYENEAYTAQAAMQASMNADTQRKPAALDVPTQNLASAQELAATQNFTAAHATAPTAQHLPAAQSATAIHTPSGQTAFPSSAAIQQTAATQQKPATINISDKQAGILAEDEDFIWTSHVLESYLNRPLNPSEIQLISYLYATLHFSSDLLLYLYEYCISLGKTNPNYVQTVALSWNEKQVHTPEEAKEASAHYNSTYTAVSKAFALGRTLASIEKSYVDRWQGDWDMDLSVILEACNRTMLKIQKADFKYAEGILDNWHKSAIHTLQDVEKADEVYAQQKAKRQSQQPNTNPHSGNRNRNQFQAFAQRGTTPSEVDALERKLLMR